MRKFFMSFLVTIGVLIIFAGVAYAAFRIIVQPPDTADYVVVTRPVDPFDNTGGNASSGSGQNSGGANSNQNSEPEILGIMTRRPEFHTFLVFGLDIFNNVDVAIVGSFNAQTQEVYLISIPRDTRLDVNRSIRKVSASFSLGRGPQRDNERGITQLIADIHSLVGFEPDFYVMIDFRGFTRLVDSVGGVEITVPFHMRYTDPAQNLFIDLPAGTRTLNGAQALNFVRYRNADEGFRAITDFQRIENQQQMIASLLNELLSARTITRVPELIRNYQENVTTELTLTEKLWFAAQLPGMSAENLSTYTLPIAYTRRAGWYEMPDKEAILELVNRTVNPFTEDITEEMVRIAR